jgi:hypothetical protein
VVESAGLQPGASASWEQRRRRRLKASRAPTTGPGAGEPPHPSRSTTAGPACI